MILLALAPVIASPWVDEQPRVATDEVRRPIVGFRATGDTKVTDTTLRYLSHFELGDEVSIRDIPAIEQALQTSQLFESLSVHLELHDDGVIVVAVLDDKHSWIAIPALFVFTGSKAFGLGFAENDLGGENRKLLLYAQVSTSTTFFFGTLLTPHVRGTNLSTRFDIYPYRRTIREYANDDPTSLDLARTTTQTFLNAGVLVGWNWAWWFTTDARLRGAYNYFRDSHDANDVALPNPEKDGWDVSLQTRATIDTRSFDRGVTDGSYLQLHLESSVPGLDDYGYQIALLRAYRAFRFLGEHQLEFRTYLNAGRHLPLHEELSAGGTGDLRGYSFDQFRGDRRYVGRVEYSFPLARWRWLSFRGLGFFDSTCIGFESTRDSRAYLPGAGRGDHWWRNDAGGGLRIYVNNIVLPLLGFDIGRGLENHANAFYLQVGLTDF